MSTADHTVKIPSSSADIDFGHFIVSLATSAMINLGETEVASLAQEGAEPDIAIAQQSIEIIGMLREKTRGNLTLEEQELIDNLLYDLRLRYIEITRKKPNDTK